MKIRIADLVNDSIVDGQGIRFTIFTQGCLHNCKGCHNPKTHDLLGGKLVDADKIIDVIKENPLLDGITLSGGEPFLQSEECTYLAKAAHDLGLNVWAYSGFTFEEILNDNNKKILLENIDILVDGKFEIDKRSIDLDFKGSSNQRIIDVKKSIEKGSITIWNN